ncbi:MAG: hypothetical protein ABI112_04070 [Terracoccus sp.]
MSSTPKTKNTNPASEQKSPEQNWRGVASDDIEGELSAETSAGLATR